MTDNENTNLEGGSTPPAENAGAGQGEKDWTALPEWARKEYEGLKARLSEVNQESAGRRHEINQLNERLAALEKRRQEGLTLEEKLKEAEARAQSLLQYEDRVKTLEDQIRKSNELRKAALPESYRVAIPDDLLTPEQVADYLDRTEPVFKKPVAPDLDGGAGSGSGGKPVVLTPEQKQMARRTGMTDEQFIEALKKSQR